MAEKCLSRAWMSYNWFRYPNLFQFNEEGKQEINNMPVESFDFDKASVAPFPTTLLQYKEKICAVFFEKGKIVFRSFPNKFRFDESYDELEVYKTTPHGLKLILEGKSDNLEILSRGAVLFEGLVSDDLRNYTNTFLRLFMYVVSVKSKLIV